MHILRKVMGWFVNDHIRDIDLDDLKKKKHIEPLAPVDHSKLKYEDFTKNFYIEHEDITHLTQQ